MEYEKERAKAWRHLRKGLFFLVFCAIVYEITQLADFPFNDFLATSATIAGWVALWRPIEDFLYDLPDLKRRR